MGEESSNSIWVESHLRQVQPAAAAPREEGMMPNFEPLEVDRGDTGLLQMSTLL